MFKVKTFTSQLKIFHTKNDLDELDRAVNDFLAAEGIRTVVSVSDAVTTGSSGETIGIIRTVAYVEAPAGLREYREKAEKALKEWSDEIEGLREKAEGLGADARKQFERQAQQLRARHDEVRRKLAELARSGGEAWEDLRAGADAALKELRKGIDKAVAQFKGR